MSCQACLVVLCGIPASGKSTTAKYLQQYFDDSIKGGNNSTDREWRDSQGGNLSRKETICVNVSYDELISEDLEQKLIENEEQLRWKRQREDIIGCVDHLLQCFYMNEGQPGSENSSFGKEMMSGSQNNATELEPSAKSNSESKSSKVNSYSEFKSSLAQKILNNYDNKNSLSDINYDSKDMHCQRLEQTLYSQLKTSGNNGHRNLENESRRDDDSEFCTDKDHETLISEVSKEDSEEQTEMRNHFHSKITNYVKRKLMENGPQNLVIVIDDNMYYSSMRYKYYQLARKYTCGFCQVCFNIDVKTTLSRNECRKVRKITEDVIVAMATKLEIPDPKKNPWEEHSLTIGVESQALENNIRHIVKCIESALDDPVMPIMEVDEEVKEEDRRMCRENLVHQADQVIRKLIKQTMIKAKDEKCSQKKMKSLSQQLTIVKSDILRDIKAGNLLTDISVNDYSVDITSCDSKLFVTLAELFHQKVS